jgi:hypothetical protein
MYKRLKMNKSQTYIYQGVGSFAKRVQSLSLIRHKQEKN